MDTIFITNDPWRAQVAEYAGVDRVMVDLEILGKIARQRNLCTVVSGHSIEDVGLIRSVLKSTVLMVRINPMHEYTEDEIGACISSGADILMLPMFSRPAEVQRFIDAVSGRARTCLLIETAAALARIHDILNLRGIDEVHVGLNDLHLDLKLDFMFEIISGGLMDYMADVIRGRGTKFGIGGVARVGMGLLSAELILSEHVRLGSSQVLLSRDYGKIFAEHSRELIPSVFRGEIERLQQCVTQLKGAPSCTLFSNSQSVKSTVEEIVSSRASFAGYPKKYNTVESL